MLDNITLMLPSKPPPEAIKANGQPFEYNGQVYCPKYSNGQLSRYEAQIKNLRVLLYPERIYLTNSLHKFFHGNNYGNFYLSDLRAAIEGISDATGYNWSKGIIKKIEYGCNIPGNGNAIAQSLVSYRSKEYLPMATRSGNIYGKECRFKEYGLKGYDKRIQVWEADRIRISDLFRFEVKVTASDYLRRMFSQQNISLKNIMLMKNLKRLAADTIEKFNASSHPESINFRLMSAEEKKIYAVMQISEIRDDFKTHHKEAYKKYRRIYGQLFKRKGICNKGKTGQEIAEKMNELIHG